MSAGCGEFMCAHTTSVQACEQLDEYPPVAATSACTVMLVERGRTAGDFAVRFRVVKVLISIWGEMARVLWELTVLIVVPYSCSIKIWREGIPASKTLEGQGTHPSVLEWGTALLSGTCLKPSGLLRIAKLLHWPSF